MTMQNDGRQYTLVADQEFTYAYLANGVASALKVALPAGAIILGGGVLVQTAWDGTTVTLNVGDSASATRYASAVNLKAAGYTELTKGFFNAAGLDVQLVPAIAGTPTVGKARLIVQYAIAGVAVEVAA